MSNKIWTVQEIEIATHPSYLKRYPVGDGLTLAVHPSGRMTWERSLTQEGKLRWKTFGVHHPKTDRKYITEIKARSENETFLEKRSDGIIDQRVDTSYTVEDVIKKYLLTVKHPSTNQSYNSVLKILSSLYHKKWIHLTDDIIEQEIYNKIESKEISLVASKECFYAIRRVSRYSLVSRSKLPKVALFPAIKYSDLKFGKIDVVNFPSITNDNEFKGIYKRIKKFWEREGRVSTAAIIVMAHFPKRVSEICNMKWEYIDFKQKVIRFPAEYEKVKSWKLDYPMSDYLVGFLSKLYEFRLHDEYVFCVRKGKPLTQQAVRISLNTLSNGAHSPHGFRASFRTIGQYILKYNVFDMELTLGHKPRDSHKGAYDRISTIANINERRELANNWSDWLES